MSVFVRRAVALMLLTGAVGADVLCQVIQAPESTGERLVPNPDVDGAGRIDVGTDGEIRLTYAQLTELIDEAVREIGAGRTKT